MYVSLYLIQIHISASIETKFCTRLPRDLEEIVGYLWTHVTLRSPPIRPLPSRRPAWRWAKMAGGCDKNVCQGHGGSTKALYRWFWHVFIWRHVHKVEARCTFFLRESSLWVVRKKAERITVCARVNVETRWNCGKPNEYTDFPNLTFTCLCAFVAGMRVYMWPSFSPVVWKRP
jgi:hypothetical protein